MFDSVLWANRGELARRVIRTARRMGIRAVAVYSDADADLPFVREADEAVNIGPAQPARSYLDAPAAIAQRGEKTRARNLRERPGVPVAPGSREPVTDLDAAIAEADRIGYPLMVKAAAGGGGIGM